jgi:hypothetical protein
MRGSVGVGQIIFRGNLSGLLTAIETGQKGEDERIRTPSLSIWSRRSNARLLWDGMEQIAFTMITVAL